MSTAARARMRSVLPQISGTSRTPGDARFHLCRLIRLSMDDRVRPSSLACLLVSTPSCLRANAMARSRLFTDRASVCQRWRGISDGEPVENVFLHRPLALWHPLACNTAARSGRFCMRICGRRGSELRATHKLGTGADLDQPFVSDIMTSAEGEGVPRD